LHYWLVMPAAGSGQRFGRELPKQYMPLAGRTVIECALAPFLADPRCQGICVALAAADERFNALPFAAETRVSTVLGGEQRADSVLAALEWLTAGDDEWVLVHDAARPCITRADIDALLDAAGSDAVGALLAVPLADTLKREGAGRALETPSRESLWRALTPQMFRLGALRKALRSARAADQSPTDEAQALEWMGQQPRLVAGSALNLKVTTAADLALAAAILSSRNGENSR
jgi:2-C-methyl-D-erythritol 4-phosphate cytidylyltransferase